MRSHHTALTSADEVILRLSLSLDLFQAAATILGELAKLFGKNFTLEVRSSLLSLPLSFVENETERERGAKAKTRESKREMPEKAEKQKKNAFTHKHI